MFEVVYKGYGNSYSTVRKVFAVDRDRENDITYFLIWDVGGFKWLSSELFDLA